MSKQSKTSSFPYASTLDFGPLMSFWRSNVENNPSLKNHPVNLILEDDKIVRELTGDVSEKILKKHNEIIGILLSAVFPAALIDQEIVAVHIPFKEEAFFSSTMYQKIMAKESRVPRQISVSGGEGDLSENCEVIAGLFILKNFYKPDMELELPVIVNAVDSINGLEKVYKLELNTQFTEIELIGDLPELSEEIIEKLLNNLHDQILWQKYLPADRFIFRGFTINRLIDVTVQEMLSSIKYYLLKRDAVTCGTNFLTIQDKIRSLFRMSDLKLGIVFFDESNNIISNAGLSEWNSFLSDCDCKEVSCASFQGSLYDQVFKTQRAVIIEDLNTHKNKSTIEAGLISMGIQNIGIAPLINNGKVLGMLELATPNAGQLNNMNAGKLVDVLPMFTAAIERVLGDLQVEVRALIQKECTAIHPSVEWKFIEEGFALIRNKSAKQKLEMPEIVFENVFPLFGMSDIRNSSVYRNTSIREDLVANLEAAQEVLSTLYHHKQMYIFNELNFKVSKELERISNGLASGDESNILDFIRSEVNTALNFYQNAEPEIKGIVKKYFDLLDPDLGVIYSKRQMFEESLMRINETISNYIEEAEKTAQDIYPHYFEKYKTDGVEYNMYIGESMTQNKPFDTLYLKNFRLWQLIMMTEIARKVDALQPELTHPLEITQLILVQNEPLDIRFRKDEKHFDVDGAYNIRYEIIKKRIDKAFIKGTSERLTQPGKISIVYSHEKEAQEYADYIEYLQSVGALTKETEYLELEDVQGANGLRALRIEVNPRPDTAKTNSDYLRETIAEALG